MRTVAFAFLMIMTGCTSERPMRTPIAIGPAASVASAAGAAHACGITNVGYESLDYQRAKLSISKGNSETQVDCTLAWIKEHWGEMGFEPLMVGNERP